MPTPAPPAPELDVAIIGAGLSGIDAAWHLQHRCPDRTYAIFEARGAIGGTWDLFRYPGVRSDSDMHTLGFPFRPWRGDKAIADGSDIRDYIEDTARAFGIDRHIRFRHRIVAADWSSDTARWTLTCDVDGVVSTLRCRFLFMGCGYYDYARGHAPDFAGQGDFAGPIVHPQHWPQALDVAGKRVAVIGSGATAVTLVPALAARGAQVTMVQRSPSHIVAQPARDRVARLLYRLFPERLAGRMARWKSAALGLAAYQFARRWPRRMEALILKGVRAELPDMADVDRHFTPRYDPWDQRLCLVPDADLFAALRDGSAIIATDTIRRFTPNGIELGSGARVDADIIVTATGLRLHLLGGIALTIDGAPFVPADHLIYRGMMASGVPNLVLALGYTNASWTLKIDLVSRRMCRMLNHMRRHGHDICLPTPPGPDVARRPLLDFSSGYVTRAAAISPAQGSRAPWRLRQNYFLDYATLRFGSLADGVLRFARAGTGSARD
ncbi:MULTISPECIES: flavin-containing monooxygenase [unclassified Sphingomonas]|uniref:flavin-containing monooxygenase n=1 Tax=unclassified Sphingomonas TaxID=196159 RepID=UPI0006FA791A|nr:MULTISPECIES: NAD(P)/FAD-dependent oxidoreductase [unclassified Sphingomonas]KQM27992.1 FAD-containing monooxygenase EthA [Sphingomonas sp. Leaf9]KQM44332.1 FAD-containing monooxygenase EthA [Sphingomonas sp. Leaf11]